MKYSLLGACLLGAAMLVGCGAQPGSATLTWSTLSSTPPAPLQATDAGVYKLYPSDSGTPVYTAKLDAGDRYGFETDSDGKIVGFAKDQKVPLDAKLATSYVWKEEK